MDVERKVEICRTVRHMILDMCTKLSELTGKPYCIADATPYYANFTSHVVLLNGLKTDIEELKKLYREYEITRFGLTEFESLLEQAKKYKIGKQ